MLKYILIIATFTVTTASNSLELLKEDIQKIVDLHAEAYNATFSIAIRGSSLGEDPLAFSSGDFGVTTHTNFAWGSITKMWTGASIMQLVARGKIQMKQKISPIVDPILKKMKESAFSNMNFSSLSDLYGKDVDTVTIENLLAMQSGIPDFDTANPSRTGPDLDPFRASVYANPTENFSEPTLMSLPWVATHNLTSKPGTGFHYSSTNFGILGLIVASFYGHDKNYMEYDQSSFLNNIPSLEGVKNSIRWAVTGSPKQFDVIPGFDRTTYNGQNPSDGGVNVVDVAGVFAGYSAADFVGSPSDVAMLGYALWGNESLLVPSEYRDLMVPSSREFYGLASQNVGLMGIAGGDDEYSVAYGHLGATYGYDSIFAYNPTLDVGIAIASNIETSTQTQPSAAFCAVYNRVRNYLLNEEPQVCTYVTEGYYGGTCTCYN